MLGSLLADLKGPVYVHINHGIPFFLAHAVEKPIAQIASIIHDNINASILIHSLLYNLTPSIRNRILIGDCLATGLTDFRYYGLGRVLAVLIDTDIIDNHF